MNNSILIALAITLSIIMLYLLFRLSWAMSFQYALIDKHIANRKFSYNDISPFTPIKQWQQEMDQMDKYIENNEEFYHAYENINSMMFKYFWIWDKNKFIKMAEKKSGLKYINVTKKGE